MLLRGRGAVEDVRLQALKVATGVESELVNEHRAGAAEGGKRVGLAARAVQRAGKQLPGRLAPRVFGDMGTQFGNEIGPFPGVEEDTGAQFHPPTSVPPAGSARAAPMRSRSHRRKPVRARSRVPRRGR
ncbi:hypothetical protein SHKM778_46870 [Streptomyces sp. KM77-8]|uniref:Uncharacterized protein n=1 Tax=Streptomyces haneummycinicus TaxID=3074435 RepID=A0AAT9HL96_9ACTN